MKSYLLALAIPLLLLGLRQPSFAAEDAEETVIPLKVETGDLIGRDSRVWLVPVTVNNQATEFTWGCGGWTIVSETVATKCDLRVHKDDDVAGYVDGSGQPIFLGAADADIRFAGRKTRVEVKVMKDAFARGMAGTIGYDIARRYQWTIRPDAAKPTMTLREPGAKPTSQPVATLPMKEDDENFWLTLKVRGETVDICLMPQSSDMQAAPDLQKKWDIQSGKATDIKTFMGPVRTVMLTGKDAVEFSKDIVESNVMVLLVGDPQHPELTPAAKSGLGASILNRYAYCVDPERKEFAIFEKMPPPATRPARPVRPRN